MKTSCFPSSAKRHTLFLVILILFRVTVFAQEVPQPANPRLWAGASYNDAVPGTGADRLHQIGITGQGVTAAVVDAGYYVNHEIFDGKIVNNYAGSADSHGTHVSGIILSMAPDAKLWLAEYGNVSDGYISGLYGQIAQETSMYNIVAVNNSWGWTHVNMNMDGYYSDPDEVASYWPLTDAAVRELLENGVIVVGSSGNSGVNDRYKYPGGLPDVLAVGALNQYGYISDFSTQFQKNGLFIVAPGVNIFSATHTDGQGNSHYGLMSGTSMAAPHVTGAVTLLSSGARTATADEVISALYDSADRIIYDGAAVVPRVYINGLNPNTIKNDIVALYGGEDVTQYTDWLDGVIAKYANDEVTNDEWRILNHLDAAIIKSYDKSGFLGIMNATGALNPLQYIEYGFLRVDKAFMTLTSRRMESLAARIGAFDAGLSGILDGYAGELGADINGHTAQVFQRLDALDFDRQIATARRMSPRFMGAVMESAHINIVGLHRSLGRRSELNRFERNRCVTSAACPCCGTFHHDQCRTARKTAGWVEGFGSGFHRQESLLEGAYSGHFAGTSFGLERRRDVMTYGLFGNWSNHGVRGDGHADGNWGTFGGYARMDRNCGFIEGSVAGSFGRYKMTRNILVPGVVFTGSLPGSFVYDWADDLHEHADSKFDAQGISLRLAGGRDLWKINGWRIGHRMEMSLSYLDADAYTEDNAGSLNLHVDGYKSTYLEGGLGLAANRFFVAHRREFMASGKLMGMVGSATDDDMSGHFTQFGSPFQVDSGHATTAWIVPEATLAWNLRSDVTLSGSYIGRFGECYSEHTGSLAIAFCR